MPRIETARHAVRVTESLRELLKIINFPEIPEEANYIAFFDDGEAAFIEKIEREPGTLPDLGSFKFISTSIHENVQVQLDD